jgi:hypothetical protein
MRRQFSKHRKICGLILPPSLSAQNRPQSRFAATFAAILGLLPRRQKFRSFSLQKQFLEAALSQVRQNSI